MALVEYDKALRINPHFDELYYRMGVILLQKSRRPEAMQAYDILKKLNPEMARKLKEKIDGEESDN